MEMFALIKDVNGTRIVKGSEVQEKANFIVRKRLNDFFNDLKLGSKLYDVNFCIEI